MQRASSTSLGLRSSSSVGTENDRQFASVDVKALDQAFARTDRSSGRAAGADGRCGSESLRAAAHRRDRRGRRSPGPPTPVSSRPTRRRIRARMMRSPSSASSTSRSRSRRGGMTSASTASVASASTRDGRPESCASSPMNEPGPCVTIGSDCPMRSVLRDVDLAAQDDESARRDLAGRDHAFARRIGSALAEARQPLDLRRLQHRKHLLASGFDQRTHRLRHRFPQGQASHAEIAATPLGHRNLKHIGVRPRTLNSRTVRRTIPTPPEGAMSPCRRSRTLVSVNSAVKTSKHDGLTLKLLDTPKQQPSQPVIAGRKSAMERRRCCVLAILKLPFSHAILLPWLLDGNGG